MFVKRRWFRFTLRTLLLLATAAALVAALVGNRMRHVRQTENIVTSLQENGAAVEYQRSTLGNVPGAAWAARPLGEHFLDEVEVVTYYGLIGLPDRTAEQVLPVIEPLEGLKKLDVGYLSLSDMQLQSLTTHPQLTMLTITGPSFSPAALSSLTSLKKLEALRLMVGNLSPECMEALAEIDTLQVLSLSVCKVDEGCIAVLKRMHNLKSLKLECLERPPDAEDELRVALPGTCVTFSNRCKPFVD